LNGNHKQITRILIFALLLGGGSLLNINSATAAPGPKPIVKAAPPPPVKVTQLPSFMPWTVTPPPLPVPTPQVSPKVIIESGKTTADEIKLGAQLFLIIGTSLIAARSINTLTAVTNLVSVSEVVTGISAVVGGVSGFLGNGSVALGAAIVGVISHGIGGK